MAIKLNQSMKQTQSLMMTPQLQQAIKLLTLTHMEMTDMISAEMVENPTLEESGSEVSKKEYEKEQKDKKEATSENFDGPDVIQGDKDQFDWASYADSFRSTSSSAPSMSTPDHSERPNYENMVSRGMSLPEHLEWQLRMESLEADLGALAKVIIHNINDDGYLEVSVEQIAKETDQPIDDVLYVLETIQKLDPVGCGARDLRECLLMQAKELEVTVPLVEMIISRHLKELQSKDYEVIMRETGAFKEQVKEAEMIILSLNPKPGRLIGGDDTHYVVPDIYVKQVGNDFIAQLNDEGVPRLRISAFYQKMLAQAQAKGEVDKAGEYIQDKLRSALWLIKSIENRQKTILKVAKAIIKHQPEFFRKGAGYLRPMILKDIASEIGMHESTVSRVTTNKYMHTPLGVFELKFFFNAGIGGKNGGIDIAGETLKIKIKKLVESENHARPLSDQKIVELLGVDDIVVARRTVAKYREMLHIPSSAKRKKMYKNA